MSLNQLFTGQPASAADGVSVNQRGGKLGDSIVSELHGRFFEQALRGNLFRAGTLAPVTLTANHGSANGTNATLATAAAATPMLGLWNPVGSGYNAVMLQAMLQHFYNTVTTPTAIGELLWCISLNNGAISTGIVPFNSSTLQQAGSRVKAFVGATALTGLSASPVGMEAGDFQTNGGVTYGTIGNTVITPSIGGVQNFDGQLIIPPGGVLALYNTGASILNNYIGRMLWEEVPV